MSRTMLSADDELRADVNHERFAAALTEYMAVLPEEGVAADAPGLYAVVSQSGSQYIVDTEGRSCDCPDARHRDRTCKHQIRALVASGEWPVPGWVERDAVDDQLGLHCEGARYRGGDD
jgi:hypothetical protein